MDDRGFMPGLCTAHRRPTPTTCTDADWFKDRYPEMFVQFDVQFPHLAEQDNVEFFVVGSYTRAFDARVYHWPVRGWTVSARWNGKTRQWDRCKNWPTDEKIAELRVQSNCSK